MNTIHYVINYLKLKKTLNKIKENYMTNVEKKQVKISIGIY